VKVVLLPLIWYRDYRVPSANPHLRCTKYTLTCYDHIKTAEQRTITQRYGDWYTGSRWVGCYSWYSEEGPGRAAVPPSPLVAVKCNSTPINDQCTNFILFDVTL